MTLFWTETWDAVAGVLFPTPCVACSDLIAAHDPPLCAHCWRHLQKLPAVVCRCGTPLPGARCDEADEDIVCGRCRRDRSVISRGASLGFYSGALRECVVALKYQGRHRTAERLSLRMLQDPRCRTVFDSADWIIGVPLHERRRLTRGFNQAGLIAGALARGIGVRRLDALVRIRDTPSQTNLSAPERRRNVRNAFAVRSGSNIRDSVVILVDDVFTTGATIRECATILLSEGAREVRAITVARAE